MATPVASRPQPALSQFQCAPSVGVAFSDLKTVVSISRSSPGVQTGPFASVRSTSTPRVTRPAPYVVRGGRLQPHDPPVCRTHGRTTRACVECDKVICWKCENEKHPSLLRLVICPTCKASKHWEEEKGFAIDVDRARASLDKAMKFIDSIRDGKNRTPTVGKTCGRWERFVKYASARGWSVGPPSPSAALLCDFIHDMIIGVDGEPPVTYDTVQGYLSAIREFQRQWSAEHSVPLEDHTYEYAVQWALRWAKEVGPQGEGQRLAISEEQFKSLYNEYLHLGLQLGSHKFSSYFLACVGLWFLLFRRSAWANRLWDPDYLVCDLVNVQTQADVAKAQDAVFHWSLDEERDPSLRVIGSGEKNQTQQMKTTRFTTDGHFMGLSVATDTKKVLEALNMPKGPILRKSPNSQEPWGSHDWSVFLDDVARRTGLPREKIGTTSFRRGYATAMREAGISPEYIRMIGYWWSDASKEYQGAARSERLNVQKASRAGLRGQLPALRAVAQARAFSPALSASVSPQPAPPIRVGGGRVLGVERMSP